MQFMNPLVIAGSRKKSHTQRKNTSKISRLAVYGLVSPVRQQEKSYCPKSADEYIARTGVVIVTEGALQAGLKDYESAQRHREGECDTQESNGFSKGQEGDYQGVFGFKYGFHCNRCLPFSDTTLPVSHCCWAFAHRAGCPRKMRREAKLHQGI